MQGDQPIAESAEPKIDAWAAYENTRFCGPSLVTRIDSRRAGDGNPPKRPDLQSPLPQQERLT